MQTEAPNNNYNNNTKNNNNSNNNNSNNNNNNNDNNIFFLIKYKLNLKTHINVTQVFPSAKNYSVVSIKR